MTEKRAGIRVLLAVGVVALFGLFVYWFLQQREGFEGGEGPPRYVYKGEGGVRNYGWSSLWGWPSWGWAKGWPWAVSCDLTGCPTEQSCQRAAEGYSFCGPKVAAA